MYCIYIGTQKQCELIKELVEKNNDNMEVTVEPNGIPQYRTMVKVNSDEENVSDQLDLEDIACQGLIAELPELIFKHFNFI